jgi:protocatechuate 3,4-dioxygenase alpha subunit
MTLPLTAAQTVGPFFHIGSTWLDTDDLASGAVAGRRISVSGCILDGDGAPVPDALIELWQADAEGRYAHPEDRRNKPVEPGFTGFGRVPTDGRGTYRFRTVKPGPVPGPRGSLQAPHINVTLFMRGQLTHLWTRIYFADESANATDPILNAVDPGRRGTLLAVRQPGEGEVYRWDIAMQGDGETVFFDF